MGWRQFHSTGAKLAVNIFVGHDGEPAALDEGMDGELADKMSIASIVGMDRDSTVAKHGLNDYNLGKTHNLEFINILTDDGLINENGGPYQGQKRFDVRYTIQEDLKKLGLYVAKKDNPMTVPRSERSKDIIEPIMKPQWWVNMSDLAGDAVRPTPIPLLLLDSFYSYLLRSAPCGMATSRSSPSRPRRPSSTGCPTSMTGAFRGNCGGDISAPSTTPCLKERRASRLLRIGGLPDALKKRLALRLARHGPIRSLHWSVVPS